MTALELARAKHVSKTIACGFSSLGRRRVLAGEKALRRKAERLGLYASKTRTAVGGWRLISRQTGAVIAGPGLVDWQLEAVLDRLATERASK